MLNMLVNKRHCLLVKSQIIKIPHDENKNVFTKRLDCFFAIHIYVRVQVMKENEEHIY